MAAILPAHHSLLRSLYAFCPNVAPSFACRSDSSIAWPRSISSPMNLRLPVCVRIWVTLKPFRAGGVNHSAFRAIEGLIKQSNPHCKTILFQHFGSETVADAARPVAFGFLEGQRVAFIAEHPTRVTSDRHEDPLVVCGTIRCPREEEHLHSARHAFSRLLVDSVFQTANQKPRTLEGLRTVANCC